MNTLMIFSTFLLPTLFALAGLLCGLPKLQNRAALIALIASRIAPALLVLIIFIWAFNTPSLDAPFHATLLSALMLILVVFMSWVLVRFSQNYMAGEARVAEFYRWLMLTLAAVTLTLCSNHLLLFWAGWVGISLGLHFLLTFYTDRPRAILAAHKKFILARVAEVSLLIAFVLLYSVHDTWYLQVLMTKIDASLTWQEQTAAVLIAIAALMKCAQLPVHGWLMQVVEAPTPISALLHAGIINLGGYLILIFYPLLHLNAAAIWLILIVSGLTTVLSALIMTTRISIKVRLAWSTSAQMGLMLLECALGLYELAVLHLLAHSVYKAHAFLNSGNAVNEYLQRKVAPDDNPHAFTWLVAAALSFAAVMFAILVWQYQGPMSPWLLLFFALTVLVALNRSVPRPSSLAALASLCFAVAFIYAALKVLLGWWLADRLGVHPNIAFSAMDLWVSGLVCVLFALAVALRYYAHLPWVRRLSVVLFAGLYLDEWFTKITLKIWPISLPAHSKEQHRIMALRLPMLSKGNKS